MPSISRRAFVRGASLTGALALGGVTPSPAETVTDPLKVCVFSDLHFCPGVWTNSDSSFLEKIIARAKSAGCDMMIHLGDLLHGVRSAEEKRFLSLYSGCGIPAFHVPGNHDQDHNSWNETREAFGLADGHYSFDRGGFRFVVLDPNYIRMAEGKFVHYENGNAYHLPKGATLGWVPPEQVAWLRERVVGSPLPCVVLSHQSLEKCSSCGAVPNAEEIRKIFNEANARNPGTVRVVMNGHDHLDFLRILDGILYWDVNSANYQYYSKPHALYPASYMKTHAKAGNCIAWDEPLSAILTLWPDGRVRIEGSKAGWLFGVSPVSAGYAEAYGGRLTTPVIQSADLILRT